MIKMCLSHLVLFAEAIITSFATVLCASVTAAPSIQITSIPTYGTTDNINGVVAGGAPASVKVALFVYVGGWYTKPTFATPAVTVQPDGSWTADITGPASDNFSTRIAAVLIPASATPPQA